VAVDTVFEAIEAFWGYLAAIQLGSLAVAIGCHVVKTLCTALAWRNTLAAAYADRPVRFRSIYGAYIAGVGVNAILPARAGDVARVWIAHRAIPASAYPTIVASSAVLSLVDVFAALLLLGWALTQGLLPGLDALPSLPSFDFHWVFDHQLVAETLAVMVAVAVVAGAVIVRERAGGLRAQIGQAFAILQAPSRYIRGVVFWQIGDWALRFVAIWFFLGAFGIEQSLRNVALVQVTHSLSTLIPISPGGIGTEQALIAYVFRGIAPAAAIVPFSVGMKITLTVVNVVLAFVAIALTARTLRVRGALRDARAASEQASGSGRSER
jgi:uncharacterized membrane protein YbhN (UPF0104 family)